MDTDTIRAVRIIAVDYGESLQDMIAAGKYDWKKSIITAERFPIVGEGTQQFEAILFHFGPNTSSENAVEAIKSMASNPWKPGRIEHILAFGAKHPEEQRKYPIIGLGSVAKIDGHHRVPYLSRHGTGRALDLHWWNNIWDGDRRFLAVRNCYTHPGS